MNKTDDYDEVIINTDQGLERRGSVRLADIPPGSAHVIDYMKRD